MRVLVTGGATREYIDGVRYITNFSTGKTASIIAENFSLNKWEVFYLHGKSALRASGPVNTISYEDFSDLNNKFIALLGAKNFDLVIHAAAVSDYSVSEIEVDGKSYKKMDILKISSSSSLIIKTRRNFKILNRIKEYATFGRRPVVVGFKLTNTCDDKEKFRAIEKISNSKTVDFIVHNDLNDIKMNIRKFNIYADNNLIMKCNSQLELAQGLLEIMNKKGQ